MNLFKKILALLLIFTSPIDAVILRCSFANIEFPPPVGLVYTCYNVQVTNPNNSPMLESILGTHVSGKTNAHVKGLTVGKDGSVTQFPRNMHNFFPNLLGLEWYLGVLTSITANDLQFPSLQHLHLSRNRLNTLNGDLLKHMPRLARIAFYSNSLQNVGPNFLDNLNALSVVNFLDNPCIDYRAETAQQIATLKNQLANQCPRVTTTTRTTPKTTTTTRTNPITTTTTRTTPTTTTSATTTTEKACPIRCTINEELDDLVGKLAEQYEINLGFMQFMNDQTRLNLEMQQIINEQRQLNLQQNQVNKELNSEVENLNKIVLSNLERIEELEKRVREILSVP